MFNVVIANQSSDWCGNLPVILGAKGPACTSHSENLGDCHDSVRTVSQ